MLDLSSMPLLHVAAFKGQHNQLDQIIKCHGIPIETCTEHGDSVYHWAVRGAQLNMIIYISFEYRLDFSILNHNK